ncbi:hypothetical protein V8E36_008188, partial [Tilletia maclaganii]
QTPGGALKILQANVGRSGPRTDALLRRADEERIDIILVQEPGGYFAPGKECPRIGSTYQPYLQREGSGRRPRVVTYVRKSTHWRPTPRQDLLPEPTDDILLISLSTDAGQELLVANIYNAP